MQTALSRIWTQFVVFISYAENYYAMGWRDLFEIMKCLLA